MTCTDDDRELVRALRFGDARAVERFVDRYAGRAYHVASWITGREEDAATVVQVALGAAIGTLDTFTGEFSLNNWFCGIAARAAYQTRCDQRDERSLGPPDEAALPPVLKQGRPGEPLDDWSALLTSPSLQTEIRRVLTSGIADLPVDDRAVLILHDLEGLSLVEIGELFKVGTPCVRARLHRARLFLRKGLDDYMVTAAHDGPKEG